MANNLEHLYNHSHYARRLVDADPGLAAALGEGLGRVFSRAEMLSYIERGGTDLSTCLRKLRQQVWLRVAARDLAGIADLGEVMATMTDLAEVAIQAASQVAYAELLERFGVPIGAESGLAQQLIVIAMGKLGGAELNVSSDVDLIFAFPEDGETSGTRVIGNQEFFNHLGKRIIAILAEPTVDGFVFRVDMRLRPYGDSGALTLSFAALEAYFVTQGRPWERYAWIKARPLTGHRHDELDALVKPFVFRRYLDYGAISQLRDLHRQIRAEVMRRDRADNVKLGPGGIREIEFLAQVFQLIRGGRDPKLQSRSTSATLDRLAQLNLLSSESRAMLGASYQFLRNLEHRLQYLDDAQTHSLPTSIEDRVRIAQSLGKDSYTAALTELAHHRDAVAAQFNAMFGAEKDSNQAGAGLLWQGSLGESGSMEALETLGYRDVPLTLSRLNAIQHSARYRQLPETSRARFDSLAPTLIESAATAGNPDATLARALDLLEAVSRRETYLALLLENPGALKRLLAMASASAWAIKYLAQHPILLDELLDHRERNAQPDWVELKKQLHRAVQEHDGNVEQQWEILRHFKQAQMFNLIAQDIAGDLVVEHLSDHLSDLADCILDVAVEGAWRALKSKHRELPRFCVVGYGKLGGKELGYGSDLDIIFLYDDDHADAPENYARLAQRLNSWLTTYTSSGVLYETDLRLRPDGASGLLVSSVAAFEDYQLHHAWIWEHQALTRARFCSGDFQVGAAFERLRANVLQCKRDLPTIRSEVSAMREKMRHENPAQGEDFDIKQGTGGLIDIEFIVQFLILGYASQHVELTANIGNIALLKRCGELRLIDTDSALAVANAYRVLRRLQHRAWLDEQREAKIPQAQTLELVQPVKVLWREVFERAA